MRVSTTTIKPTITPTKLSSSVKPSSSTTKNQLTKPTTTKPSNSVLKTNSPISKPVTQTTESNISTSKTNATTVKPHLTTTKSTTQKTNSPKPSSTIKPTSSQLKSNATTKPINVSKVNVTTSKPSLSKNNIPVRPVLSETKSGNSTNKVTTSSKTTEATTKLSTRPSPTTVTTPITKPIQTTKITPRPISTTPKSTSTTTKITTTKINTMTERSNITTNKQGTTEKSSAVPKPTIPNVIQPSTKPNIKPNNTSTKTNTTNNLLHNSSSLLTSSIKISNYTNPQTIHKHTVSSNLSVTNISEPYRKTDDSWKLVATIPPPHSTTKLKIPKPTDSPLIEYYQQTSKIDLTVQGNFGMPNLSEDMQIFSKLYNELALKLWSSLSIDQISSERSVIFSPFGKISLLAMIFLGARGGTSGELNDLLKLDDIVTFNPHLKFKEVTESITKRQSAAAIVRELYSDNTKGKILDFYKERVRFFYDGHVEEVDFKFIKDVVKRRTNFMIKKQTRGYMQQYLDETSFNLKGPLAALSMNIFQVCCIEKKFQTFATLC